MDNKNHSLIGIQHNCLKLVIEYSNIYEEKIFLGLKNKKFYFTSRKDINYSNSIITKEIEYKTIATLKEHISFVNCMLFYKGSEGENYILSGGGLWDKTIKLWLYPSLKCVYTFKGHKDCIYSLISLNIILKNHFASGSRDHSIKIWNLSSKECGKTLVGHTGWVKMLTHLKHYDNQLIASCSIDKTIRIWNVITGECISVLEGHTDKVVSLMFLKRSHINFSKPLLVSGSYRELFLWDLEEKKKDINLYGHKEYIWCMIYLNHMSSNFICTGCEDHTIKIWDLKTSLTYHTLEGHTSSVYCLVYLKKLGNNFILSGSRDFTIRIWDVIKGESIFKYFGLHQYAILTFIYIDKFSDEKTISVASGAADNLIKTAEILVTYKLK